MLLLSKTKILVQYKINYIEEASHFDILRLTEKTKLETISEIEKKKRRMARLSDFGVLTKPLGSP